MRLSLAVSVLVFGTATAGSAEVRRLALAAGANHGRPERVALRYAVADAERFVDAGLKV